MGNKPVNETNAPTHAGRHLQRARPTIGYLAPAIHDESQPHWSGIIDAAWKRDVNLICFLGGNLADPNGFRAQANVLYDLVSTENVDGVVSWGSAIGTYADADQIKIFHERYRSLPITCIGVALERCPFVFVDGRQGMREVMLHLVQTHGYRRVALVRGPEQHAPTQRRYQTYLDVLEEQGLPVNPDLVAPPVLMERAAGAEAIRVLLDQRRLQPKADFEAIVVTSDRIALGVMDELQARRIHIPEDVAVAGYDNLIEGRAALPPLTSVEVPFHEQGERAIEVLLMQLAGEPVPAEVALHAKLVRRQSCGCQSPAVVQAAARMSPGHSSVPFEAAFAAQREKMLTEITQAMQVSESEFTRERAAELVDAFSAELKGESSGLFLSVLESVLRQVVTTGGDAAAWHGVVSVMRHQAWPHLSDNQALARAEDLVGQARVMIGEAAQQAQVQTQLQADQQAQALREIGEALITAFDVEELMNIVAERLPRLGIPSCYISLYDDPQAPLEWSRLVLAYNEKGRIESEPSGQRFPSCQLAPEGILPQDRRYTMVVEPLYFQKDQIGFALFEVGPRQGTVYETLRAQISSALQGAMLVQRLQKRATLLQTAAQVSRATSSILDPDELIQHMVDLVRERFGLYYTGLFLVDQTGEWTGEPGKWAVLRAGTGEAGRKMLEQGHRLEVGGNSMIGWCAAHQQARIAADVGLETVHFKNPLLPDTHSELALPLISRGHVIGAMTVQSTEMSAFRDEDITTLQTMADQLANAIENARLFAERKRTEEALAYEQYLMNSLMDSVPYRIYFKDAGCRFIRVNRAWARHRGVDDPAQAVGKTDFDFLPEENARSTFADEQAILSTGQPLIDKEGRVKQPDGQDLWSLTTKMPLLDKTGRIVGTFGITRDITQLKQAEIERERLLAEVERHALQLQAAAEVSRATSSILEPGELMQQSVNLVRDRFGLYYVGLFLLDPEGRSAVLRAGTGEAGLQMLARGHRLDTTAGGRSMVGWCITNRQARIALDVGADAARFDNPLLPATRSELALPLISRGQVIGAMTVQSDRPTAFSDDDITVLQTMADQLANAIENARLLEQEQTRAQELTVLNEMSRALSAELELDAVLRNVYQYTSRLMDATNLYVALYDAELDEISFPLYAEGELIRTSTGRKAGQGLTEYVIRTCAPVLISENVPARLQELGIESIGRESQSWLGVPMTIGAQVIGVIAVQSYTTPRVYNERHRDLLYVIANQAAIAVQNARLFGQVQATLKELEDTHRRYLQEAWTDYLQFAPATSYETGRPDAALLGDTVLPEIQQAMAQNSVVIAAGDGDHSTLVAPIALRGQVIGTVDIQGDGTRHWTEEEMALVQAVSERIAQIAENLRLFDETQRRAARERLLNEITARIRSSVTMEAILNSTVREISHLTRASSAEIELQVAETDPDHVLARR